MGFPIDRIYTGQGQYVEIDVPSFADVTPHDLYKRTYFGDVQINPRNKRKRIPVFMRLNHRKNEPGAKTERSQLVGWLDEVPREGKSSTWNYRPHYEVRTAQPAQPAAEVPTEAPAEPSEVPAEAAASAS